MLSNRICGEQSVLLKALQFIVFLALIPVAAQTTIIIQDIPPSTPKSDILYVAGSFNNWNASDPDYSFKLNADGKYGLTIPEYIDQSILAYKITRGSWEKVEVGHEGHPTLVRKFSPKKTSRDTIFLTVSGWADIIGKVKNARMVTVNVVKIPEGTPPEAPIYVTGNFNGWVPGDKRYELLKTSNGHWQTQVPVIFDLLEYKFTRGNWPTVEGKAYGRPRLNRKTKIEPKTSTIEASISHWEDQSFGLFNPYTLVLLLSAVQGLLLVLIINSFENNNKRANRFLSVLIFLISFALASRVSIYDRSVYEAFPRLALFPDIVYFLYAPIFLFYINQLLNSSEKLSRKTWFHFIPFFVQLIIYIQFFLEPTHIFVERGIIRLSHPPIYVAVSAAALLFNAIYWFKIRSIVKTYFSNMGNTISNYQNITYLKNIMVVKWVCLVFWLLIYLVGAIGILFNFDTINITNAMVDFNWILFSLTVYILGYFAIKQPEIFKIQPIEILENAKSVPNDREIIHLQSQLKTVMDTEKLYLNPTLNLPELADRLNSSVHIMSRTINEGFGKNFRDFVNQYRVQDFIERVEQEGYKNHTFLGIALDVGFNSKSSFNRSFKKVVGKTPSEYFNSPK
ncbi:helix-turn-helix domain-containing protein [Poritiphilus flavus]|uniref:Helix-turn-helix domain-containing protein n=1 Tax=Poritiphilus flavus TaxID=2697053 RepID=A0A6L9ECD8_9FLAO|nr:helix-turn-helix domain-containing protein [Poritiphilus flavus]NAS12303.1 helix-turn-helix domain-containing protein [Poritiphilus flavus]